MLPADFIGSVFSGVESGYITLARFGNGGLVSKRIEVGNFELVDSFVDEFKETLYYNVSVGREALPETVRGGKASLSAVCMLWADVDLPKAGSAKEYPPLDAITQALEDMPLRPSVLVNTGGGYHVYWLFNDPHEINGVEDAEAFERKFSKPWQDLLRVKLAKYGNYVIDSTHDTTRMMRIPGSWHKNGKQCIVEDADYSRRYGKEDFEPYLEMVRLDTLMPKVAVNIEGDIQGLVSPEKLDALIYNSPEFKKVWTRRKEFGGDASAADASIAHHGITAGWTDTEIANLIVAYNRKYNTGRDDKLFRKEREYGNYLGRTIASIRRKIAQDRALLFGDDDDDDGTDASQGSVTCDIDPPADIAAAIASVVHPSDAGDCTGVTVPAGDRPAEDRPKAVDEKRNSNIRRLSEFLSLPVASWIQVGRESPIYTLVLADGHQVKIGSESDVVSSPKVFEQRIYSELHEMIRPITKPEWRTVCKLFAKIVDVVESQETSSRDIALIGVNQFLQNQSVFKEQHRDEAIKRGEVWVDDSYVYLYISTVIRFINLHGGGKKWQNGEFVNAIRQAGFTCCPQSYRSNGSNSTKSYWRGDIELFRDSLSSNSRYTRV